MANEAASMRIREAEEGDVQSMADIYNYYVANSTATFDLEAQSYQDRADWLNEHKKHDLPVFVIEKSEPENNQAHKIIGFAGLSFYHSRCGYRLTVEPCMYLDSASCHSGFGQQLMNRIMTAAQEKGYHVIVALVCSENEASIRLAKKHGFELVGQLKEVGRKFDRWLDVSLLQKVL